MFSARIRNILKDRIPIPEDDQSSEEETELKTLVEMQMFNNELSNDTKLQLAHSKSPMKFNLLNSEWLKSIRKGANENIRIES